MIGTAGSSIEERFHTIPEALGHWSRVQPDEPAVSARGEELSYGEFHALVEDAAARLRAAGVQPGERLALLGANSIEWTAAFCAGLRLGAVVVPLNRRLSPLELGRQIELADPHLILVDPTVSGTAEKVPSRSQAPILTLSRDRSRASLWQQPRARLGDPPPPPHAQAMIAFTSGTTGAPRGATLHHEGLVRSASAYVERFETFSSDRTLVLVPLFHNTGFVDQLGQMLLVGGAVDLLAEFSVAAAVEALLRRPASYLIAVPSIFRLLMLSDRADAVFRDCRIAAYGGAAMPAAWIHELGSRWPSLRRFNCYGLTEFTSVTHVLGPEDVDGRGESVGRPVRDVEQLILDDQGNQLAAGRVGEVLVKGPMRMLGYWGDEPATDRVFRGQWLRTGDLGSIDQDGFLSVVGRPGEIINRGGEKIHAVQVEAALSEVPAIGEAAVIGAPHPIFGQRVVAAIVPRGGERLEPDDVRSHLLDRVADYAVPEELIAVDALPRNAAGKLDRRRLALELASVLGEPEVVASSSEGESP